MRVYRPDHFFSKITGRSPYTWAPGFFILPAGIKRKEFLMVNKKTILFAFLAGFLVLSMAGCKDSPPPYPYWLLDEGEDGTGDGNGNGGGGGGGGGGVPSALIAVWYADVNGNGTVDVDQYEDIIATYEFRNNGEVLAAGVSTGLTIQSEDSNTLATYALGQKMGTVDWAVSGNALVLSNASVNSGMTNGNYAKK
jgi:hypothetical protein